MKHYFAQTEREDILLTYIDELYTSKCEQFNDLAPADCGCSSGEIEDGIAQTHNRIIALFEGAKNTEQQVQADSLDAHSLT
jgi:hypothetical protein